MRAGILLELIASGCLAAHLLGAANSVFYLQKGRPKVTVVSNAGKEATLALLSRGDFIGEESITAVAGLRLATATAVTSCVALKIARAEMIRVMHEEHAFSDLFLAFLLARSMRTQADLVDQLFNSSEPPCVKKVSFACT
jgi:CRP/FNR family transcriptional regulator, cyclic AMP receptor protein